jgi:hypothetical protein
MRGLRAVRASAVARLTHAHRDAAVGLRAVVAHQETLLGLRASTITSLERTVETLNRTAAETAAATARLTAEVSRLKAAAPAEDESAKTRAWIEEHRAERCAQDARDLVLQRVDEHARLKHELDVSLHRTSAHALLAVCLQEAWSGCLHTRASAPHDKLAHFFDGTNGCVGLHALMRVAAADNYRSPERVVAAARALQKTVGEHALAREEDAAYGSSIPLELFNIDEDITTFVAFAALVHFTGRNVRHYLTNCEDAPMLHLRDVRRCHTKEGILTEAAARAAPLYTYWTMR